jgi:protein-S-isoprenylcysteine O-methyltransferase Ste14
LDRSSVRRAPAGQSFGGGAAWAGALFVALRAATYAALFIATVLVFLPARVLQWSGIARPKAMGTAQVVGGALVVLGGALALWCVITFTLIGRGTPAPFDPPRRLVVRGPYRFVRNPMYLGAGCALGGAALFSQSLYLLGYGALFLLISHLFVRGYEEPTLRRTFGEEYDAYCRTVARWRPSRPRVNLGTTPGPGRDDEG